jgi:hypothetical protein
MKKRISNKWFVRMRGSYLPCSWQAWACYLVAVLYLSIAFAYIDDVTDNVGWIIFHGLKELIVVGIILTWIAQQRS